ncbi:MAG TPA: two-component regulator propeller domain-containing protein [Cyclobacteriaceae bacterium]|nr:two-component regulator propeller domain-containing protein [Cyclobacteriaceae bacterium]
MNRVATFLFALSILASTTSYSQYFQSTNFREGSGLPSSESYMVFEDSKGFVWIATDNGVVRYDGHEFVTYNVTNGLTDNTVFGFDEDPWGRIWFRTYNGLLSYYENDTIKTYKYNAALKSIIGSSILTKISYDSLGELYFSATVSAPGGKIDSTGKVSIFTDSSDGWTFIGFIDNKMTYGDSRGLPRNLNSLKLDDKVYSISLDDSLNRSTWLISSVKWKNKVYFSMHKNIFVYDGQTIKKVYTARHAFVSLYVDHEDRLWAGHFNNGVVVFNDESLKSSFSLANLSTLSVSSVLQDYEDGVWISTLDQGVFYFPNLTVLNYNSPSNMRVSAVAHTGNDVFLGNYGGEVFKMTDGKIQLIEKGVAPVSCLFLDRKKQLWITDGAGTHILQSGSFIGGVGNKSISFKALTQLDDYIIGCTSMGLVKILPNGTVIEKTATRKRPSSMAVVENQIYLGGLNGVEKFDSAFNETAKITNYRTASLIGLENRFVMVGTIGNGLYIYDCKKRTFTALPVADAVSIYSIVSDWPERRLWLGTDKGLFQIDFLADTSDLKLSHFSKADGLISSKINNVCRIGDNVWAISDLGISSVPLDHFSERNYTPKFYINRLLFRNESLAANASFVRTEEEDMVIDVRAITFKGHPTLFRYRLSQATDWKMVSGGSIFLTDLPPDAYHLEVQASTGYDHWTSSLEFEIDVLARWWQTWTFRVTFISTFALLGYLGYWLRINAIRRRQKYLELINLHQQKLIDSEIRTQERERKRIATDLHDGIGASLSSIKIQVADAMREDEALVERAHEINENLNDVIDDIKRIVYDLHPPGLERYGLQAGLKNLVDRLNKTGDINVIFDYYGKREVVQPVSLTIFRILQELINNTLKHARASEIRIHINEFDDEINIMYEDNGIGMVGSRFTGLGMHSIESRVRSLDGRMSWESNHKGTFYNFDIPF